MSMHSKAVTQFERDYIYNDMDAKRQINYDSVEKVTELTS